jgi:chromosome segregation ATPase
MRTALPQAPEIKSMAEMLDVLSKPEEYQKRMSELQAFLGAVEARLAVYNTLEKVQAYHKEVKAEAAAVSKSKAEADALWDKLDQSSKELAADKIELDAYNASMDEHYAEVKRDLDAASRLLQAAQAEHEQDKVVLAEAQAKLRDNQAKHDARKVQYADKLESLCNAIQGVLEL